MNDLPEVIVFKIWCGERDLDPHRLLSRFGRSAYSSIPLKYPHSRGLGATPRAVSQLN